MHDPRDRGDRRDPRNAQDAPGAIFSRGAATPVSPLFRHSHRPGGDHAVDNSATLKTMWTLPPLWTHRTRPQGFGNLAKNARFPQRPHRSSFSLTKRKNEEQNHADQLSTESDHPQCDGDSLRVASVSETHNQLLHLRYWRHGARRSLHHDRRRRTPCCASRRARFR